MSFGSKPKKIKAKSTLSNDTLAKTTGSNFNTSFGSANAQTARQPDGRIFIDVNTGLSKPLGDASLAAQQGLGANLRYLGQTPTEQVSSLTEGRDPLYNLLKIEQDKNVQRNIGRARLDAMMAGRTNSTTEGSLLGKIYNDDIIRQNTMMLEALNANNNTARQNAGLNLGAVGTLGGMESSLGGVVNANLLNALQTRSQVLQADANRQLQAAQFNAQMANQGSSLGSTLGSLAGTALGAVTGTGGLINTFLNRQKPQSNITQGLGVLPNYLMPPSIQPTPPIFGRATPSWISPDVMPATPIKPWELGRFGSDFSMGLT